jgi:hypothetical protein
VADNIGVDYGKFDFIRSFHHADSPDLLTLFLVRDHLEQMCEFISTVGVARQEVEAFRAWRERSIDEERANGVWFM